MKSYGDDLDASKPYFGKPMPKRGFKRVYEGKRLTEGGKVEYLIPYSTKYPAGGDQTLVDGKLGMAEDINDGWQAFEGTDIDGATEDSYTFNVDSAALGGAYTVTVSNPSPPNSSLVPPPLPINTSH